MYDYMGWCACFIVMCFLDDRRSSLAGEKDKRAQEEQNDSVTDCDGCLVRCAVVAVHSHFDATRPSNSLYGTLDASFTWIQQNMVLLLFSPCLQKRALRLSCKFESI